MEAKEETGARLQALTSARLGEHPGDRVFERALVEVRRLREDLGSDGRLGAQAYESQQLGLLCVRELEAVDPAYCAEVYAFLDQVRPL